MATPEAPAARAPADRNHGLWIFLIWLPLAVVAMHRRGAAPDRDGPADP